MKELNWRSEFEFGIDGIDFQCAVGDYTGKTNEQRFILLKDREVLEQYATVFAGETPKTFLEFGIFQGGSPTLFALWFDAEKFVGVDHAEPVAAFDEFCRRHPVGDRIRTYYGVSQSDRERVEQIIRAEFGSRPIDVVIDDASHQYDLSKRTFEIAFPRLRPGGTYVIEDWGWAHWSGYELGDPYQGKSSFSMLIMELVMLCASRPDLLEEVRVFPAFAFVRKSRHAKPMENFALQESYHKRNIDFVSPEHWNLKGVSRSISTRVAHLARRRLARTKHKLGRILRGRR